jgi:PadR family transcriptional regulator PadR
MQDVRITIQVLAVLDALLGNQDRYGFELCQHTRLKSGTLYPILARLEQAGWITSEWESDVGRGGPRRRYYRLTGEGATAARDELARLPNSRRVRTSAPDHFRPPLTPGRLAWSGTR